MSTVAEAYDEDALLTARNKFVTLHLAIQAHADAAPDLSDAILSIERVFDEALRDLDRGLKLNEPAALAA
jgi:hypothetical protein